MDLGTKSLILAAGQGRNRMGRLTSDRPKSLFKVDRKPLIEMQIDAFRLNDFSKLALLLVTKVNSY